MTKIQLKPLLTEIRACQVCAAHLPHPPNPVLRAHANARLLLTGQAPGGEDSKRQESDRHGRSGESRCD